MLGRWRRGVRRSEARGSGGRARVTGLTPTLRIENAEAGRDVLVINALVGERLAPMFAFSWMLALFVPGLCVAVVALIAGVRALKGESWSIPILGRLARQVLSAPQA